MTGGRLTGYTARCLHLAGHGYVLGRTTLDVGDWARRCGVPERFADRLRHNGVETLHWAETESLSDLALAAAEAVLGGSGTAASSLDIVVVASTLQTSRLPAARSLAVEIAGELGATQALCLAVSNMNCVSGIGALGAIEALFGANPQLSTALLVTVDRSALDRYRAIDDNGIMSDGAGAILVTRQGPGDRVRAISILCDTTAYRGYGSAEEMRYTPLYPLNTVKTIGDACGRAGIEPRDLAQILPHILNRRGWGGVLKLLRLPEERLHDANFARTGHVNCSDMAVNLSTRPRPPAGSAYLLYSNAFAGFFGAVVAEVSARVGTDPRAGRP